MVKGKMSPLKCLLSLSLKLKRLLVLYAIHIWLPHKILIYHVQRSNCPVITNFLYQSELFLLFTLIQTRIFYVLQKGIKMLLILILYSQLSFYRLNFLVSALCLSVSFKVQLKMATYFFLRSNFRLYGFTRI